MNDAGERRQPARGAMTRIALGAALLVTAALPAMAQQFSLCGQLQNGYGPFDYRKDRDKLPIVDNSHFTPEVEMLMRGVSGYIGGDLDYALRAFPNHHRALVAMMRLGEREKTSKPRGANYTVECYFDRATRFVPNDTVVRSLYATFLSKAGRRDDALAQLEQAVQHATDNPFAHYNIGLVYLEMKVYDKALVQAHRAIELGFPRTELADGLRQAGAWKDPVEQSADDPPTPMPASASAPQGTRP